MTFIHVNIYSGITKAIKTLDKEGVIRKQNGHTSNDLLHHIRFAVFGLGSRAYSNFCAFGHQIDNTMGKLGAVKIQNIGEGDELCGQEESFLTWAKQVFQVRYE
jgi:sulfite reductase alpha subunit-like flavoprotein